MSTYRLKDLNCDKYAIEGNTLTLILNNVDIDNLFILATDDNTNLIQSLELNIIKNNHQKTDKIRNTTKRIVKECDQDYKIKDRDIFCIIDGYKIKTLVISVTTLKCCGSGINSNINNIYYLSTTKGGYEKITKENMRRENE